MNSQFAIDSPRDKCGVFGIYAPGEDVARLSFFALHALQHRGQESAGIATSDGHVAHIYKSMGLVSQVFNEENLSTLPGHLAIAHNRYSTTGSSKLRNAQPLLIETALPEIETEANRLLGRMTDGRMTLNFKPQEETKAGTVRETLAINIGDELGTRNYEMFSGGEAFRINFAIRIALSRLLARRAGAPLPTLIIDEGFGTQDNSGIEKLKEAISSVKDDFDRILVITHMDDLKDAFPVRIDVTKTAEGSTISVN